MPPDTGQLDADGGLDHHRDAVRPHTPLRLAASGDSLAAVARNERPRQGGVPKNISNSQKGVPLHHERRVRRAQAPDGAHQLADGYATASASTIARAPISAPRNASSSPEDSRNQLPAWWPWNEIAWYGFRRSTLIGQVGIVALAVGLASDALILWAAAVFFFAVIPLCLSILLVNRPRMLVPPKFRHQQGVLTDYLTVVSIALGMTRRSDRAPAPAPDPAPRSPGSQPHSKRRSCFRMDVWTRLRHCERPLGRNGLSIRY